MGRINVELDDDLHTELRLEKAETGDPIKEIVRDALDEKYGDDDAGQVEEVASD